MCVLGLALQCSDFPRVPPFWLMSWQELGHSTWGRWSGHGRQIFSLQEDNYLSREWSWTHNAWHIIHIDLIWKWKQRACRIGFETTCMAWCITGGAVRHSVKVSATLTPLSFDTKASPGFSTPFSLYTTILFSHYFCSVYETGVGKSMSGSSGTEDGPWRAASCFDGSRLPLRW